MAKKPTEQTIGELAAELQVENQQPEAGPMLRVICKRPGFRRAGRAWPAETILPASELSEAQRAQIEAEPLLHIEPVSA